jgi:hypothetical protein
MLGEMAIDVTVDPVRTLIGFDRDFVHEVSLFVFLFAILFPGHLR